MHSVPFLQISMHAIKARMNSATFSFYIDRIEKKIKKRKSYSSLFSLVVLEKKKIKVVQVLANYAESNLIKPKYSLQHPQDKYFSGIRTSILSFLL